MIIYIGIVVLLLVSDLVVKYLIATNISIGESISIIDGLLYITHIKNTGAAWGILKDGRWFFVVITVLLFVFLIYFFKREKNTVIRTALAIIMGGALGNFVERLIFGEVTDFIGVYIFSYEFPIFNIADISVVCGTILLGFYIIFLDKGREDDRK